MLPVLGMDVGKNDLLAKPSRRPPSRTNSDFSGYKIKSFANCSVSSKFISRLSGVKCEFGSSSRIGSAESDSSNGSFIRRNSQVSGQIVSQINSANNQYVQHQNPPKLVKPTPKKRSSVITLPRFLFSKTKNRMSSSCMDLSELQKDFHTINEDSSSGKKPEVNMTKQLKSTIRRRSSKFKQMFDLSFLPNQKDISEGKIEGRSDHGSSSKTSITSIEAVTEKFVRHVSGISLSKTKNDGYIINSGNHDKINHLMGNFSATNHPGISKNTNLSRSGSGVSNDSPYRTTFHNPNYTNIEDIELRLRYYDLYGFPIHHEFLASGHCGCGDDGFEESDDFELLEHKWQELNR